MPKLDIKIDFRKEHWFIRKKYPSAEKAIGRDHFSRIINFNVPNAYRPDPAQLEKNILSYLRQNQSEISSSLQKKKRIIQERWNQISEAFFRDSEGLTGIRWRKEKYTLYFLASCFWGGDYDENGKNIYISPLLPHGDPLYIILHELSHLLFWEYIYDTYPPALISRNHVQFWALSEIMVNYPLLKMRLGIEMPVVIPHSVSGGKRLIKKFGAHSFKEIITQELKRGGMTSSHSTLQS